jgi:hypothetical protein
MGLECPRCSVGFDDDGDGNCAICARLSDEHAAKLKMRVQLRMDRLVFGNSFELDGERVDPRHVKLHPNGTYSILKGDPK